jgi:D-alanyl-D-alanine carboxypeptidase
LLVAAGVAVLVQETVFERSPTPAGRPELQRIIDRLVTSGDAPGVTALVTGPRGTWVGSAGVANIATGAAIRPDARMRIESNSKTWLTAVILAQEGKLTLDDTVEHWLPGLLRAHGSKITLRQLMHDTSGLVDDPDTLRELNSLIARVGDSELRAQLLATAARLTANPQTWVSPVLSIHLAAWQPLLALPGTAYHHSNIGWNVAGLIAAKAGGKPLPVLYRERIFQPLGLQHTAFSPQGPIAGPHSKGYARGPDGRLFDTTAMHPGKFADGAIVTNVRDEATFLRAAMNGTLFPMRRWRDLYGPPTEATRCGSPAYVGVGSGDGYRSHVLYDGSGGRIAVLLLNDNRGNAASAALRLYCAA